MLTKEHCRARRQRLWDRLDDKPDWILISDPQSQMYFANYYQSPFVFRSANAGAMLILGRDGSAILVADNLVQPFVDAAFVDDAIAPIWYNSKKTAPHREAFLTKSLLERAARCSGSHWGIESATLPAGILASLQESRRPLRTTNVDPIVHQLKRSKDPDEVELMKRSMTAAEAGHAAGMRDIRPGMTELDAFLLVERAAMSAAGEQAVVYGDFVSGPNAEKGGGPPTDRVIEAGNIFLLDFSVVIYGYRCDFANAFVVAGSPNDAQRRLYDACIEAITAGEALLKAGVHCQTVDRAVRDVFDAKHLGENFGHHSGHGIGLGHPDPPYIVPGSEDTLVAGDIVTLEPGQYVKGVGGMRFERNYLITPTGYELLSKHALTLDGAR